MYIHVKYDIIIIQGKCTHMYTCVHTPYTYKCKNRMTADAGMYHAKNSGNKNLDSIAKQTSCSYCFSHPYISIDFYTKSCFTYLLYIIVRIICSCAHAQMYGAALCCTYVRTYIYCTAVYVLRRPIYAHALHYVLIL